MNSGASISILKVRILKGMSQLILREVALKFVAVVGQILLVRLLAPDAFGLYSLIIFGFSMVEFFTDFGVTQIIIQNRRELTRLQLSTLFFIRMTLVLIVGVLTIIFLIVIPEQFKNLGVSEAVLLVLFPMLLIKPIKGIAQARLDRLLNYQKIALTDGIGIITYYIVAIGMSLMGIGVWSLVWAVAIKELTESILSVYFAKWFPGLMFSLGQVSQFFHFGLFLKIGDGILLLSNSVIPIFGGWFFSPVQIGYLAWGKSITSIPNALLDNYGRVALTGMSKIQTRKIILSSSIRKSIIILNLILFLFFLQLFGFTYDFIYYVASEKWLPAVISLKILVMVLLFSGSVTAIAHGILAMGKAKELALLSGVITVIEFVIIALTVKLIGFNAIALAITSASFMQFVSYYVLARRLGLKFSILKNYFLNVVIIAFLLVIASYLNYRLPVTFGYYVLKMSTITFLYIALQFIFARENLKTLIPVFSVLLRHEKK